MIDLHTHSNASDGQYAPAEVVAMAKAAGIRLLALTDHDTVDGIAEAKRAAQACGLPFVPGIEISTRMGVEIHILGLGIREETPALLGACSNYRDTRIARAERICEYLKMRSVDISMEEILEEADGAAVGRPHFARVLVKKGLVSSKKEAFRRYLETPTFHRMTDSHLPRPEDAIDLIHASGGKAVLAHPGMIRMGRRGQEQLILSLKEAGLDGLEAYYSGHEFIQTKKYRRLAADLDLQVTAGSDYHGEKVKPKVRLGMRMEDNYEDSIDQWLRP